MNLKDYFEIPQSAFGKGMKLFPEQNRMIGADGILYEGILLNADDVERNWPANGMERQGEKSHVRALAKRSVS